MFESLLVNKIRSSANFNEKDNTKNMRKTVRKLIQLGYLPDPNVKKQLLANAS